MLEISCELLDILKALAANYSFDRLAIFVYKYNEG